MYKCKRCLKDFPSRSRLFRHLRGKRVCRVHIDGEDIDRNLLINTTEIICTNFCSKCNKQFRSTTDLKNHEALCFGDNSIWEQKFIVKRSDLKFCLEKKLIKFVKNTYLRPEMCLIKYVGTNYFKIYKKGIWVKIGKYNLVRQLFEKFLELPKSAISTFHKTIISNINKMIYDQYTLSHSEKKKNRAQFHGSLRGFHYFYSRFYHRLVEAVLDPDSVLSYKEYVIQKILPDLKQNDEQVLKDRAEKIEKESKEKEDKYQKLIDDFKENHLDEVIQSTLECILDDNNYRFAVQEVSSIDQVFHPLIFDTLEKELEKDITDFISDVQNWIC